MIREQCNVNSVTAEEVWVYINVYAPFKNLPLQSLQTYGDGCITTTAVAVATI